MEEKLDPPWLTLNKYGVPELIYEQCENKTCTCAIDKCAYDDAFFREVYFYEEYRSNMLKALAKEKKENLENLKKHEDEKYTIKQPERFLKNEQSSISTTLQPRTWKSWLDAIKSQFLKRFKR
jgi:hypothetical protein